MQRVRVETIELDLSEPEHIIVMLLRDLDRPQRLFGWRTEAVEPTEPGYDHHFTDPEFWTTVIQDNLEEDILDHRLRSAKGLLPRRYNLVLNRQFC